MTDINKEVEGTLLQGILREHLQEQRTARRWKVFFRMLLSVYVLSFFILYLVSSNLSDRKDAEPHIGIVDVMGIIASDSRTGASAESIITGLRRAFESSGARAVVLRLNTPGGSPVQSSQVYREILRLRKMHPDRPVFAVAEDMAASGGYYIAAAAESIYADRNSMVGSVGVIMSSFGFTDLMDKFGVDRRVYTAGTSKAFMDPFSEENAGSITHVASMLQDIHRDFIGAVKLGRGDRLKAEDEELFNGLVWTGGQALELGLIDGIGSVRELAESKYGITKLVNYSKRPSALHQLAGSLSASIADTVTSALSLPAIR